MKPLNKRAVESVVSVTRRGGYFRIGLKLWELQVQVDYPSNSGQIGSVDAETNGRTNGHNGAHNAFSMHFIFAYKHICKNT